MRTASYYRRQMQRYFDDHYKQYEEHVEFYPDPAPNAWKFIVPELSQIVTLVCSEDGLVTASVRKRQEPSFKTTFR